MDKYSNILDFSGYNSVGLVAYQKRVRLFATPNIQFREYGQETSYFEWYQHLGRISSGIYIYIYMCKWINWNIYVKLYYLSVYTGSRNDTLYTATGEKIYD